MSHKNAQKMLHLEGMGQNITGPFQSQQKVNFLFWRYIEHGNSNWDETKDIVRGFLELSKKSKNSQKYGKLSKIHYPEVGRFWTIAQRDIMVKMQNFPNGPIFFLSKLVHDLIIDP